MDGHHRSVVLERTKLNHWNSLAVCNLNCHSWADERLINSPVSVWSLLPYSFVYCNLISHANDKVWLINKVDSILRIPPSRLIDVRGGFNYMPTLIVDLTSPCHFNLAAWCSVSTRSNLFSLGIFEKHFLRMTSRSELVVLKWVNTLAHHHHSLLRGSQGAQVRWTFWKFN